MSSLIYLCKTLNTKEALDLRCVCGTYVVGLFCFWVLILQ